MISLYPDLRIPITQPFQPPKEELLRLIEEAYDRNWLTNQGPLVTQFEKELSEYSGIKQLKFVSNGTIALQIALQAIFEKGEVITTPYSYIATTSSIIWEGCTPVFADIDEASLNVSPKEIEALISERTKAILVTHVYGNACEIDAIGEIADRHGIPVIYDAAHCFGTKYKGQSIFQYGDLSTASFHATKLFHTVEGGAVFSNKEKYHRRIHGLSNFGHTDENDFDMAGINGKNSEFHAAMGLCNFKYLNDILNSRKQQWSRYFESFITLSNLRTIKVNPDCDYNHAYFPIILDSRELSEMVERLLLESGIKPRRYFSPSLNTIEAVQSNYKCPVSESIATRVLCLPLFFNLTEDDQKMVCKIVHSAVN